MDKSKIIKIKGHAYCKQCETELYWNEERQIYEFQCECYKGKNRVRILLWCDKCQKFTSRQGAYKNGKCMSCATKLQHKTMKKEDPEGYAKRQSNASHKAHESMKENKTGIYSQEVRDKIEETKQNNGFYDRLHQSNKEWKDKNPEKVKEIALNAAKIGAKKRKEEFTEEDWINWTKRSCNSPNANKNPESKSENTGIQWCETCQEYTFHLNNCCTKCHPSSGTGRPIGSEKAKEMRKAVKNPFDLNELRKFYFKNIDCNKNCKIYNCCQNKNNNSILKNKWGWCNNSPNMHIPNFIFIDVLTYKDEPIKDIIQKLNDKIYNVKDFPGWNKRWCSKCNRYEYHYKTECIICGNKNKLTNSKFVKIKCINYYKMKDSSLINCENLSNKIINNELDIKNFKELNLRYCNNCKEIKLHYVTECLVCGNKNKLTNSKFIEIKGVKYYRMSDRSLIDCQTLADKILNKELNITDFPGFNIRFGRVCKDTEDIITGEILLLGNSNFVNFKNVEHVLDHSTNEYVPSDKFFNDFDEKVKDLTILNNEIKMLINEDGFLAEPIIKISNDTWNRDETEKMLEKKNYHYIVYVKLFRGKPWIVGKTGTKLVNQSGIDFDFKIYNLDNLYDTNYSGPGRTYAHRYYPDELYSDFDYVLCKNFDSEQEALIFEQFISKKYNIFES